MDLLYPLYLVKQCNVHLRNTSSASIGMIRSESIKNGRLAVILWLSRIARNMNGAPQTITPEEETVPRQIIKEAPHRGYCALLRSQPSTSKGFGHVGLDVSRRNT